MLSGLLLWYRILWCLEFNFFADCRKLPSNLGIEKVQQVERTFGLEDLSHRSQRGFYGK